MVAHHLLLGVLASSILAAPALAQAQLPPQPGAYPAGWEQAWAEWLAECRSRHGSGNTVGGAVLGGVVGGIIGNRVAGRGNRSLGTVAGAAAGAATGSAIGSAADRRAASDWCEAYLERNISWGYGGQQVVGRGYQPMTVMVPVAYVQTPAPAADLRECYETVVTEEWVPVPTRRTRSLAPRARPIADKRVRAD